MTVINRTKANNFIF